MALANPGVKRQIAADFSRAARGYNQAAGLQQQVARDLVKHLSRDWAQGRVLDAGAGTGMLARDFPHSDIVSLDIAAGMCQQAGRYGPSVRADMEALPFASGYFTGVFSSLAMQWLVQPERFLAESYRCASGWLAVSTLVQGSLGELDHAYRKAGLRSSLLPFVSSEKLEKELQRAGWHIRYCEQRRYETRHENLLELLKHFKTLGARGPSRSIRHRGDIARLESAYPQNAGSIAANWNVFFTVADKK